MFLFCHWGGKKKTNLLEWPGFFSLTFISLLYLFSVSNTKSKLNSKWVEKASAWLQQHLITLKKSVATNSIGVEYLVDYVVFVRHIVKSESTQKAKEDEIPNLSVSISAFLCSYSFIPFCNLPTTSLWRVSSLSHQVCSLTTYLMILFYPIFWVLYGQFAFLVLHDHEKKNTPTLDTLFNLAWTANAWDDHVPCFMLLLNRFVWSFLHYHLFIFLLHLN